MNNQKLPFLLGENVDDKTKFEVDLAQLPNLLVGGARGQGKSALLEKIVRSLQERISHRELQFVLFDPSHVEFCQIEEGYFSRTLITSPEKMMLELERLDAEIEKRLTMFAQAKCRNLADFNARPGREKITYTCSHSTIVPYIVVVADDMTELIAEEGVKVRTLIRRLTARARAAGLHFIMSVRSMDPATMQVFPLDNFPARIAFKTWSAADSTALVGVEDAKDLSRLGEFIFRRGVDRPIRCQLKAGDVA